MYYPRFYYYPIIGQVLPPGLSKKLPPIISPTTPAPNQVPTEQTKPFEPGIAIIVNPLGLDLQLEPRRASNRIQHLFDNESVQVLESDIPEIGLGELARPRWWRVISSDGKEGFIRALDEIGNYKLRPLTTLPGRGIISSTAIRRRGPLVSGMRG